MPKFMKDRAIALLDGGIETYILGLYGLNLTSLRIRKKVDTKNAPVMGMFGASVELLVKACLVQAYWIAAMYKSGDVESGIFKFEYECINEFKNSIRDNDPAVAFIWNNREELGNDKNILISVCL